MTVETELQEIVEEETLAKEIKDLSDTEKAKIVRELTVYSLSDAYIALDKELKETAEELKKDIDVMNKDFTRDKSLVASQLDRDVSTVEFMKSVVGMVDDTNGGKVFKINLERNVKNFEKAFYDRVEPSLQGSKWYDEVAYTALDMLKHERLLQLSVKQWLSQTITAYEKPQQSTEEQGAY